MKICTYSGMCLLDWLLSDVIHMYIVQGYEMFYPFLFVTKKTLNLIPPMNEQKLSRKLVRLREYIREYIVYWPHKNIPVHGQ